LCSLLQEAEEDPLLVRHRMTPTPVTVTPQDTLATAQAKMTAGRFRRLPVVQHGALVDILTDRDIRRHVGMEERTQVVAAMTESLLTVSPVTTVEEAAQLMLKHQISGLPVLEDGKLVGIITISDVLHAENVREGLLNYSLRFALYEQPLFRNTIPLFCLYEPGGSPHGTVRNDPCRRR
jgi:acetoin utilization protein AcuB